jgi:hypothetical protein
MLQANQQSIDGRATITNIVDDQTGRRATAMVSNFPDGSPLSKAAALASVALGNFAGNVQVTVSQFRDEVVPQNLRVAAINGLSKPFVGLQSAAIAEQQAIDKAMAVASTVDPASSPGAQSIRDRAVRLFEGMDIAGRAGFLQDCSMEQLAGILETGAIDDVPADMAAVAKERWIVARHVQRTGLQAGYQRQPGANDPLASGPDVDAALAASRASLDVLKARGEDVVAAANTLRGVTTVVALATDLSVDQAFALLTGATNAN